MALEQHGQACNLHVTHTYVRAVKNIKKTKIFNEVENIFIIINEIEYIVACTRPVIMIWSMTT